MSDRSGEKKLLKLANRNRTYFKNKNGGTFFFWGGHPVVLVGTPLPPDILSPNILAVTRGSVVKLSRILDK